ncbi:MAG: hypothetical protein HKN08_11680 [Gammaproteobacteria bacterium]|nr:hypothetical protein [Gammaproteobacteria bacterium]
MLKNHYAIIGTARHKMRTYQYDPAREILNLDLTLDMFIERYKQPDKTIQFGCSGGGHVSLAVAEAFADRIDGSVALAAHTPVWLMNTFLDGWFVLRSLIGEYYTAAGYGPESDLKIIEFSNNQNRVTGGAEIQGPLVQAWRNAITAAYQSDAGRARLMLAFAIGQWGPWLADSIEIPDLSNPDSLLQSAYQSALRLAASPGGAARLMFENAAYGQQLSGNTGLDFGELFENSNPSLKHAVEELYSRSDANLQADISRINSTERIQVSDHALEFWSKPGRTVTGNLKIPTVRMHILGDHLVPVSLLKGYVKLVNEKNKNDLYRTMYIRATGHCDFAPEETLLAVKVLLERIDSGRWPDTAARELNKKIQSISPDIETRFMSPNDWEVNEYNRTWAPN